MSVVAAAFSAFASYQGPLPPAAEMKAYEDILPGAADRILAMAEGQARHRQDLEKKAVYGGSSRAWWGLWLGFIIALLVLGGAIGLVESGHDAAGTALGSIDLVSLAAVFVIGRSGQQRELAEKDAATTARKAGPSGSA